MTEHKTKWRCTECRHTQTLPHNPSPTRTTGIYLECERCGDRTSHERVPHKSWDTNAAELTGSEKNKIQRATKRIMRETGCQRWEAEATARAKNAAGNL